MTRVMVIAVLALAACGRDGEPTVPVAQADVSISSSGVHSVGRVGVRQGPVTVTVGF